MYRTTIKGAFSNNVKMSAEEIEGFNGPQIYAIRDGDVAFYVGQSIDPFRRIGQHMGYERRLPSELGVLILENQPESDEWTFECYGLKDCEQIIRQSLPEIWDEEAREFMLRVCRVDQDKAEACMIQALKPCLNGSSILPAKYTHVRPNASSSQFLGV